MNVTLITGASSGIGEAFAWRLAKEKHNLLLIARSEQKLQQLCQQLAATHHIVAEYVAVDLTAAGSDKHIADVAAQKGMSVDWLINNAGIGSGGDLLDYELEYYQNMMQLNMHAMVALTYRFLPAMRARKRGTIINVGSMAGFGAIPYTNVYAASKGFVKYFTEALWEENRLYAIDTMLLCPGATETNYFDAARLSGNRKKIFSTPNLETPEQVVNAALEGLQKKAVITISGARNKVARRIIQLIPQKFGLKAWGDRMRKNLGIVIK